MKRSLMQVNVARRTITTLAPALKPVGRLPKEAQMILDPMLDLVHEEDVVGAISSRSRRRSRASTTMPSPAS
jgi:hypothetical protein